MAGSPITLSEAREQEYTESILWMALGGAVLVVAIVLMVLFKYWVPPASLGLTRVIAGLAALAGATILGAGAWRIVKSQKIATLAFPCPYCSINNQLLHAPTEDFDCEHCRRTIRFENGRLAPILTITCSACGTEHRVSAKAERCVCDKCNAVIQMQSQYQPVYGMTPSAGPLKGPSIAPPSPKAGVILGDPNQNVSITDYDRTREQQVASVLQRELGVDLNEARRLLGTITDRTPLIVAYDVSSDAAGTLRKQFERLGATVHVRAVGSLRG